MVKFKETKFSALTAIWSDRDVNLEDLRSPASLLPDHVLKGIEKSLQQFEEEKSISLEEFSGKHL